ncbi:unnamed protein product, partial [Tilletia caries]
AVAGTGVGTRALPDCSSPPPHSSRSSSECFSVRTSGYTSVREALFRLRSSSHRRGTRTHERASRILSFCSMNGRSLQPPTTALPESLSCTFAIIFIHHRQSE